MTVSNLSFAQITPQDAQALPSLFLKVFTASEGANEGATLGRFVEQMLETTPPEDLQIFVARFANTLAGAVFFSRLRFGDDPRPAMILSPMAVHPDHLGQGIGQALIRHALHTLRGDGIQIVLTYGDPAFYSKIGFQALDPSKVPPPLPLSYPHGWIGQSLTDAPLGNCPGPCVCVPALNDPALW